MKTLRPFLALLTLLGCSDDAAGPLTPAQLCAAYSNANVVHDGHPPDEELEQLAHVLPGGFGGMIPTYFYLKDPTKADAVRATAATLADCDGMNN